MKRSKPKFSNQRINDREDDFLLADVFALDDDTQLVDIRFDTDLAEEDAIDRLLFRSGFDPINEQQAEPQPVTKTETPPSAAPVPVIDDVQSALATMGLGNNETTRPAPKLEASADEAGAAEEQRNPYTSPSVLQALYKTKVSSSIPPVTQAEPPPARPAPPQTERPASAPEPQSNAQILAQLHANQAALEEQLAHLNRRSKAALRTAYTGLALTVLVLIAVATLCVPLFYMKQDMAQLSKWVEMLKDDLEASFSEKPIEP